MTFEKAKLIPRLGLSSGVLLLAFFLACAILTIDFFSKSYVAQHLPLITFAPPVYPYGGIPVFNDIAGIDFSINHAINKGAAWGILAAFQHWLLVFRILVIIFMIGFLAFFNKQPAKVLPFTAIIAGASGNVIDYFVYGHVVDMFHFEFGSYSYPIFNVADSAIFCGIVCLFFQAFYHSKKNPSLRKTAG
jgi:signal peptidase II